MYRECFSQQIVVWEVDKNTGQRLDIELDLTALYRDSNDVSTNIQKSITSNPDTADIEIFNHHILEQMYSDKLGFFRRFFEKDYEVDVLLWYEQPHESDPNFAQAIYSGDLDDLYAREDSSNTDQALVLKSTAGRRASLRTRVNKKYPAGTPYLAIVQDMFSFFNPGYQLTVLDDPLGKLNKTLPKPRTYHRKVIDVLNDIARDLEMTWGFGENPWTIGNSTTALGPKTAYFVDKRSVFDLSGIHGTNPHECNGSTAKKGRIGYTKSQFTFNHLYDHPLNIGAAVAVSDFGTMKDGVEFFGRVNRLSISNTDMHLECAYLEDGLAVIERDKKHAGALVL